MTRLEALWATINCTREGQPVPASIRRDVLDALTWAASQAEAAAILAADDALGLTDPLDYTGQVAA